VAKESITNIKGADRAAIFLLSMDDELAAEVLSNLENDMIVDIAAQMPAHKKSVDASIKADILQDYVKRFNSADPLLGLSKDTLRDLLEGTVSDDRLENILDRWSQDGVIDVWKKMSVLRPEKLVDIIKHERPQTIAIILANMDIEQSGAVLDLLPPDLKVASIVRMSKLEDLPKSLMDAIERSVETRLSEVIGRSGSSFDGMSRIVDVMKNMDIDRSKNIMTALRDEDEDLYEHLDNHIVTFDDVADMSERDIGILIKALSATDLAIALKAADTDVATKFFGTMSQRAATILQEDISSMAPLRASEVSAAQKRILETARKLELEGKIQLSQKEEMY